MIDISVKEGALDQDALRLRENSISAGAVVTFCGVVRNMNLNRPVMALDYDCAPELAEKELEAIAREAAGRWQAETVIVHHGYGYIAIGQTSVFILVATPRRDAAFEACRYVIEEIKKRVPVWKREVYADGEASWLEGTPLPDALGREDV